MSSRTSQPTPKKVLVLTDQSPLMVTKGLVSHIGDCLITLRELNLSTLGADALASLIAEIKDYSGLVFADYCLQAVMLHANTLEHDANVVAMTTTRHPMQIPMPALNLNTGMTNYG